MPQTIFVSATPSIYEADHADQVVEQVVRPTGLLDPIVEVRPVASQVDDLLSEINARIPLNERVLVTTLTKRMSEDLTEFLAEHNIKVRYLHSDIDTVERMEIIRDLRLGVFDVLVGINLLREGLDIPEVSLVAILDADKEGFLRSERSLIQTIGRAARNAGGTAILYGDKITKAMKSAIDETERRRSLQEAYNKQHNITPKTISKAVQDVMYDARDNAPKEQYIAEYRGKLVINESAIEADLNLENPKELARHIDRLEKRMLKHAENLEFEEAATLRDEIEKLKAQFILA